MPKPNTLTVREFATAAGNSAFAYEFARVPYGREPVGATHASELAYVFGTLDTVGVRGAGTTAHVTFVDRQVSEEMQQYWDQFRQDRQAERQPLAAMAKVRCLFACLHPIRRRWRSDCKRRLKTPVVQPGILPRLGR